MSAQVDYGTIARTTHRQMRPGSDPYRRRFGYAPGAWGMEIEARLSGRQAAEIPQGILVLFESGPLKKENYNISQPDYSPWIEEREPAAVFIRQTLDRFTKAGSDYGLRELTCLTPLDEAKVRIEADETITILIPDAAHAYFDVIHPPLVKDTCPMGLSVCPTCRILLLEDEQTILGRVLDAGLDEEVAEDLRLTLLEANSALKDFYTIRWSNLVGERDLVSQGQPGIKKLGPAEHHIRKCLHALAPEEVAGDIAAQYGEQQGAAVVEGMREVADSIREVRAEDGEGTRAILQTLADGQKTLGEAVQTIAHTQAAQGDAIKRLLEQPESVKDKKGGKS